MGTQGTPLGVDNQAIEALERFINHYAVPFFEASILIEVVQGDEYAPFYQDILKTYAKFRSEGLGFDCTKSLNNTYADFDSITQKHFKKVGKSSRAISKEKSSCTNDCINKLKKFRNI